MQIIIEEVSEEYIFRVVDFDLKYQSVFEMCYFNKDETGYFKKFNKKIKNIDRIKENFKRFASIMFDQLGYFAKVEWEKALISFIKKVEGHNIDWWLTGSCATCIRGIPLNPHDVDIMISGKDIDKINQLFIDYIIEPIIDTEGWVTKDFGVLFNHARIDIATDPQPILDDPEPSDCGPYAKEHLEVVHFKGYPIKVPPLRLQLHVNKRRNRLKRVKLIESYIQNE